MDGIRKSLKCEHEVNDVLIESHNFYHDDIKKIVLETKVLRMVCTKCKEFITKEYVIDVKNQI